MVRSWSQQTRARDRSRRNVKPFAESTHQVIVYDRRWMAWVALAVIVVIVFYMLIH
jgi:hypothetical protein